MTIGLLYGDFMLYWQYWML